MAPEALDELLAVSHELARLHGKPATVPSHVAPEADLPPALVEVLASGALALRMQGVDASKIEEFTERAKGRGLRRRVRVFGWHPAGHTWYAVPLIQEGGGRVVVIDRNNGLAARELEVGAFVAHCVESARTALAAAAAALVKEEPAPAPSAGPKEIVDRDPITGAPRKRRPPVAVVLPESAGATVALGDRTEDLSGEELGYIRWCMDALTLTSDAPAPDLSRWEARCLRQSGLEAVPPVGHPARAAYDENWLRLTVRDRGAPSPVSHLVAGWKLSVPGAWILAPSELGILRRAEKATPPRHTPTDEQRAIWARWMAMVRSDAVEVRVRG